MTHQMTITDLLALDPVAMRRGVRDRLSALPGLEWVQSDLARVAVDGQHAALTLDQTGDVRFQLTLDQPPVSPAALELSGLLPDNMRPGIREGRVRLIADLSLDDPPQRMNVLLKAASAALNCPSDLEAMRHGTSVLKTDAVRAALRKLAGADDLLVDLEQGWEYRPQIAGQSVAVKLEIVGSQLRCHRRVLSMAGDDLACRPVTLEALRINTAIKHARLALVDSGVVAEAYLCHGAMDPKSLSIAIRAVALAQRRARVALGILRDNPPIAEHYVAMFDHASRRAATRVNPAP